MTADWDDKHRRYDWMLLRISRQTLQCERMNNGWQVTRTSAVSVIRGEPSDCSARRSLRGANNADPT